jgi:hypothetical protein
MLLLTLELLLFCVCARSLCAAGYDDGEVETFSSGGDGGAAAVGVSIARGDLDMNQLPSTTDCDEEETVVLSSPSSTCMKREREKLHVFDLEQDMRTAGGCTDLSVERGASDDEADGGSTTRKKLRLSKEQSALLEESFKDHSTLNPVRKIDIAAAHAPKAASYGFFLILDYISSLSHECCGYLVVAFLAETKERVGKATELASSASGSVVPKQKSKVC